MTPHKIAYIKKDAVKAGLTQAIRQELYLAKCALEIASERNLITFSKEVEKAKQHIEDAIQLWQELS